MVSPQNRNTSINQFSFQHKKEKRKIAFFMSPYSNFHAYRIPIRASEKVAHEAVDFVGYSSFLYHLQLDSHVLAKKKLKITNYKYIPPSLYVSTNVQRLSTTSLSVHCDEQDMRGEIAYLPSILKTHFQEKSLVPADSSPVILVMLELR